MNKYDFLRDKIEDMFDSEQWLRIEKNLRDKCKVVFVMWLEFVKRKKLEDVSPDEIDDLVREWETDQSMQEEYSKRWQSNSLDIKCDNCVFGVEQGDEILCLQLAKFKNKEGSCSDEVVFRGSIYYGKLFEHLKMLKIFETGN